MTTSTLLKAGIAGTIVAALCCFTPVLVVLMTAVGLSAWIGWLDYMLIPALAVFVGLTLYAWRRRRVESDCCTVPTVGTPGTTGVQR
ncbi:MAG: mercury resistance system transport protein MerF [Acidobacteriota bacterium]